MSSSPQVWSPPPGESPNCLGNFFSGFFHGAILGGIGAAASILVVKRNPAAVVKVFQNPLVYGTLLIPACGMGYTNMVCCDKTTPVAPRQ